MPTQPHAEAHRPPAAIERWSTDAVPPAQRLDYWVGAVCEGFLEMEVTSPQARHFDATLESAPLGTPALGIGVNRVRGSAQDVYRTRRAIERSRSNFYYLLCKTDSDRFATRCLPSSRCPGPHSAPACG